MKKKSSCVILTYFSLYSLTRSAKNLRLTMTAASGRKRIRLQAHKSVVDVLFSKQIFNLAGDLIVHLTLLLIAVGISHAEMLQTRQLVLEKKFDHLFLQIIVEEHALNVDVERTIRPVRALMVRKPLDRQIDVLRRFDVGHR